MELTLALSAHSSQDCNKGNLFLTQSTCYAAVTSFQWKCGCHTIKLHHFGVITLDKCVFAMLRVTSYTFRKFSVRLETLLLSSSPTFSLLGQTHFSLSVCQPCRDSHCTGGLCLSEFQVVLLAGHVNTFI